MRIALMLEGQEGISWEQWLALARAAEDASLDGLFRSDHYRSIMRGDPAGSLDAWTTLAGLAAATSGIRLGTMVSPVTFRPASVLAKAATTVDHISGGRVELGIGAGWFESEHDTYGFPFLTTRERLDELDRQLAEIERQWTEADDVWPKPVQQPHPPIIVGGTREAADGGAAVRFADEYNTVFPSVEEARDRRRVLDDAAAAAGREPFRFSMMIGCVVGRDRPRSRPPRPLARGRRGASAAARRTVDEVAERSAPTRRRRRAGDAAAPRTRGRRDGRPCLATSPPN